MKIAIITANLNNFDKYIPWVEQDIPAEVFRYTDKNFPLRDRAMTSRLQAKIPKCFGWQLAPDYDIYIWVDASFAVLRPDAISWLVQKLGKSNMAVFKHPERETVADECKFLEERLRRSPYVFKRYRHELKGEWIESLPLYAMGIFTYRPTSEVKNALKEWWYFISRYHLNDQLSFPTALAMHNISVTRINEDIYNIPYFTFTRTREYLNG